MKSIFYACLLMAIGCMALETMSLDKLDKPSRWKANGGVTVETAEGVNGQAGVVVSHLPKGTAQLQLVFDDDHVRFLLAAFAGRMFVPSVNDVPGTKPPAPVTAISVT